MYRVSREEQTSDCGEPCLQTSHDQRRSGKQQTAGHVQRKVEAMVWGWLEPAQPVVESVTSAMVLIEQRLWRTLPIDGVWAANAKWS